MFAADVRDAFLRVVAGAELALVPCADGFAQWHNTGRRGVFRFVVVDGLDRGLLNVVRRRKIRLAWTKVSNVHALSLQLIRCGDDGGRRRDLDSVDTVRELHCFSL